MIEVRPLAIPHVLEITAARFPRRPGAREPDCEVPAETLTLSPKDRAAPLADAELPFTYRGLA